MNASAIALLVFGGTSAAALLGLLLRARLPPHHLDGESRGGVKLVMGLVATTAALVLGLLVSSAQGAYNTQRRELRLLAADVVVLDGVLRRYGPGAEEARRLLREGVAAEVGASIVRTRMLMLEQLGGSLPLPFLAVLVFWLSMLFRGFGLMARPNAPVAAAMLVGAASVSRALFLVLELDRPNDGLVRVSDEPLRAALTALGER